MSAAFVERLEDRFLLSAVVTTDQPDYAPGDTALMTASNDTVVGTDFTIGGQGVTITAYYPATKKAFDAWQATANTTPPPQTTTFGAGTAIVAFYFA